MKELSVAPGVRGDGRSRGWSFLENLLARQGGLHSEGWDTWGHRVFIAAGGPPFQSHPPVLQSHTPHAHAPVCRWAPAPDNTPPLQTDGWTTGAQETVAFNEMWP